MSAQLKSLQYRKRCTWHGHTRQTRLRQILTFLWHSQGWFLAMALKANSPELSARYTRQHERARRWAVRIEDVLWTEYETAVSADDRLALIDAARALRLKRKGGRPTCSNFGCNEPVAADGSAFCNKHFAALGRKPNHPPECNARGGA